MSQKPTLAQRKAQSDRDKALARSRAGAQGGSQAPRMITVRRKQPANGGGGGRFAQGEGQSVMAPTAIGRVQGASRPQVSSSNGGGDLRVRVKHREYVTDVTGSVAYAVQQYNINPGLATLFPWLSTLAGLFESYQFNSLKFQYRTESASSQVGKFLMSVDWDVLDPAPTSKQQQMQERTKAEGQTWINFDMPCDRADLLKFGVQRYVRQGAAPAASDLKTYDVGLLQVASQGVTGAPVIGELWVEYDLELITPNTTPAPLSAKIVGGGTVTKAAPFGSAPVLTGAAPISVSGATITFQQVGQYLVEYDQVGTVFAGGPGYAGSATSTPLQAVFNGAATECLSSVAVTVTSPGQTLVIAPDCTTVTGSTTRVSPYSYALA